jgi:hypothetical protein
MYIDVNAQWHGFEQAVCSRECYYEKEKRKTRSILGKDDENGRS